MRIRWLKHFKDGRTIVSDYDDSVSWRNTPLDNLTSVQLQTEDGRLYTLTGEGKYWQEDLYSVDVAFGAQKGTLIGRRIMKEIEGLITPGSITQDKRWLKLTVLADGSCKVEIEE